MYLVTYNIVNRNKGRSENMLLELRNLIKKTIDTLQLQLIDSLKDAPDMSLSFVERKDMTNEIMRIYGEYQAFMETSNMPNYNLHFRKRCNKKLELASIECEHGIYHLYVSDEIYSSEIKKEILFHEFTHIYDKEYLDKEYRFNKDGDRKTYVYTEIHAEQIRFLYMLGAKTVNSNLQNVNHNTIVYDMQGNKQSYFVYLQQFKSKLEKLYVKDISKTQFKRRTTSKDVVGSMATKFLYYIGAVTIYQRISDYQIDNLINMKEFDKCWNIKISDVLDFYLKHDLDKSNRSTLKKIDIINIGDIIMCDFLSSAKDKYILKQ